MQTFVHMPVFVIIYEVVPLLYTMVPMLYTMVPLCITSDWFMCYLPPPSKILMAEDGGHKTARDSKAQVVLHVALKRTGTRVCY